jgi:imidazolonepropionase-like amidohydrolase/Tol biopolymer transport system component
MTGRTREVEVAATRATSADIAVSPDGSCLVFSMLGHLFRVPTGGGAAEQLTFGLGFDKQPVFSPDGATVAFVSDRDGSESNVFLLSLQSGQLVQLTHETWADMPSFSPDGRSVVYGRHVPETRGSFPNRCALRVICRVPSTGGSVEELIAQPQHLGSIAFLADGRMAWTAASRDEVSGEYLTHIETLSVLGVRRILCTIDGLTDWMAASIAGNTLYAHRVTGTAFEQWIPAATEDVIAVPIGGGPIRPLLPTGGLGRFAISADGTRLYLGDRGRLYQVAAATGVATPIAFSATARLVVRERAPAANVAARASGAVRSIHTPRLSPDGHVVVFGAAGFLWRQALAGGPSERLTQGNALESSPAFSPDGLTLAYVERAGGADRVVLLDLTQGRTRTLHTGVGIGALNFSPDGKLLLATANRSYADECVIAIDVATASAEKLFPVTLWSPRPSAAADGLSVFYASDQSGVGNLYRFTRDTAATPAAVTRFTVFISEPQLTPDERTLVFRRNHSLLAVPLQPDGAHQHEIREISPVGGNAFALTPDGGSVVYAAGSQVWLQSLDGEQRRQVPIHLHVRPEVPPPMLIKHVRILDFAAGGFGSESSLLLEAGRITAIGDSAALAAPHGAQVVDARGRFAIPGLCDFHVHCGDANPAAFIANGITSVRDTGYNLDLLNALDDRSEYTGAPLPRYFYSGELFESERPYWGDRGSLLITDEGTAQNYVRRLKSLAVSFIKVYPSLSWQLQRAVCEEALHQGLPVVGHGTSVEEITKGVQLGLHSLEHADLTAPVHDDVLAMLAITGTRWTPTLASMGADSLLLRDRPEEFADPLFVGMTPTAAFDFAAFDSYRGVATTTLRGVVAADLDSIRRASRLGVPLHAGTDAPTPNCFFGSSLHWELERLVEAGLAPLEVLRIASLDAAAALGRTDLGSLQMGKAADLILLDDDPLVDIRNARRAWRVIKGGWAFDPGELLADMAATPVTPTRCSGPCHGH